LKSFGNGISVNLLFFRSNTFLTVFSSIPRVERKMKTPRKKIAYKRSNPQTTAMGILSYISKGKMGNVWGAIFAVLK